MDLKPLYLWYQKNKRSLAFRERRDAYAVWVAEVMLQQTRVAAMEDRYRNFLRLFPDQESLARAPEEDVLAAWSGLGYYRRCRNLQRAARELTGKGSDFPASWKEAIRLPGVGKYTAGAVLSQAYGIPVPAVDGNVRRLLSRLSLDRDAVDALAERLIKERGSFPAGDHNQALMELGALICLPRRPRCEACPLRSICKARLCGQTEFLIQKPEKIDVKMEVLFLQSKDDFLIVRSPRVKFFKNLWSLPLRFQPPHEDWSLPELSHLLGNEISAQAMPRFLHSITEHRLQVFPRRLVLHRRPHLKSEEWQFVSLAGLKVLCAPSLFQKAIKRMLESPESTDA
ncbi:MAG: A/G-specific adenine glycosylase [Spirochaetales bacterium]|nr:A/G-specific adenine glycosylase [Spirochaetales bacterium]